MLRLIYASDLNGSIGSNNTLPWSLPEDLAMFRKLTMGHKVLMGSNTYKSLPTFPKGLPGRQNVVFSSSMEENEFVDVKRSLMEYLIDMSDDEDAWVIGGAEIYNASIDFVDEVYRTLIHTRIPDADTWFDLSREGFILDMDYSSDTLTSVSGLQYQFLKYVRL